MKRWPHLGKEQLLLLLSIAIPLIAADLTLKALQLPHSAARTMLLAGSPLATGPEGYRRYASSRALEQSAVYGNAIAYRYTYSSNNLGLVSSPDIGSNQPIQLAIAGDSFAEGQGGFAWIRDWQQQTLTPRGVVSINYAIAGSGLEDFAVVAQAAKQQHRAQKILVLMIEHDAYRPYQRMGSNAHCSYYSNGQLDQLLPAPLLCNLYGIVWHHIPARLSETELIRASRSRQHYGLLPALNQLIQRLGQQRPPAPASVQPQPAAVRQLRFGPIPEASVTALNSIKTLYGPANVLVVQLPDLGGDSTAFRQSLQNTTGLRVLDLAASCPLTPADFHQLDNHPNRRGYQKLLGCLKRNPTISHFALTPGSMAKPTGRPN